MGADEGEYCMFYTISLFNIYKNVYFECVLFAV